MAERIRFHRDENVDPDVARALRQQGIDITTSLEVGLRSKNDAAQWAFIHQQRRVIITHDSDFLRLADNDRNHPGIAYCNKTSRSIGEIIRSVILIYEVLVPEEMIGRVEYL